MVWLEIALPLRAQLRAPFGRRNVDDTSSLEHALPEFQRLSVGTLKTHQHRWAYAAVVVEGGYEEAGDLGHFHLRAGDVVMHHEFESHLNRVVSPSVRVLNIDVGRLSLTCAGVWNVDTHLDRLLALSGRDDCGAAELLLSVAKKKMPSVPDWPSILATHLRSETPCKLSQWAENHGLNAWTVSRGFRQVFGVTAEGYRARARTHRALELIRVTRQSLAGIAAQLGFSDQAHLCRSVRQVTGLSPHSWRRLQMDSSIPFQSRVLRGDEPL